MARQSDEGSWLEWQLPPGQSDAWTTSFVGYKLRLVPAHLRTRLEEAIQAAIGWTLKNEHSDGGWGYNTRVEADADSTSYAILFLSSWGQAVPNRSYLRLTEFQQPDGGFSTYIAKSKRDSWGVSHPDVTPVAVLALLTKYKRSNSMVHRALKYLRQQRTSEGVWNSFWWNSFLYGTEANLALLAALGVYSDDDETLEHLLQTEPRNPFETGLLISSILFARPNRIETRVLNLIDRLIREQDPKGSWKSAPILRLTYSSRFEPWRYEDSGMLFPDSGSLFTTCIVLEAFCRVAKRLEQGIL